MKKIRNVLIAILTLSFVAGYPLSMTGDGSIQIKKTVSQAATDTKIMVQAASDFSLKLPADWKNNYVLKSSKKIKHGSYVSFSSKKCYQQTKEGWLFTIMRYKDDSYTDMPSYELLGKWNGYYYIALFPTDIQTMGATEDAKKQYQKMSAEVMDAATSIKPSKTAKKGEETFKVSDFSLKLPAGWKNNYVVEKTGKKKKDSYVLFYAKKCFKQTGLGWLFSIARYSDESYKELPDCELLGKKNGIYYVAIYPTDVQSEGATKAAQEQYYKLNKTVRKVAKSIKLK